MYAKHPTAPDCRISIEKERIKQLQQAAVTRSFVSRASYIAYPGKPESKALTEFRTFLLTYTITFSTFTAHGRQPTEADEEACTFLFMLIRHSEMMAYAQQVLEALLTRCTVRVPELMNPT